MTVDNEVDVGRRGFIERLGFKDAIDKMLGGDKMERKSRMDEYYTCVKVKGDIIGLDDVMALMDDFSLEIKDSGKNVSFMETPEFDICGDKKDIIMFSHRMHGIHGDLKRKLDKVDNLISAIRDQVIGK